MSREPEEHAEPPSIATLLLNRPTEFQPWFGDSLAVPSTALDEIRRERAILPTTHHGQGSNMGLPPRPAATHDNNEVNTRTEFALPNVFPGPTEDLREPDPLVGPVPNDFLPDHEMAEPPGRPVMTFMEVFAEVMRERVHERAQEPTVECTACTSETFVWNAGHGNCGH